MWKFFWMFSSLKKFLNRSDLVNNDFLNAVHHLILKCFFWCIFKRKFSLLPIHVYTRWSNFIGTDVCIQDFLFCRFFLFAFLFLIDVLIDNSNNETNSVLIGKQHKQVDADFQSNLQTLVNKEVVLSYGNNMIETFLFSKQ